MNQPLDDSLPEHASRATLASFSVGVDAMSCSVYTDKLIRDRLKHFRMCSRKLHDSMEKVQADTNFELVTRSMRRPPNNLGIPWAMTDFTLSLILIRLKEWGNKSDGSRMR